MADRVGKIELDAEVDAHDLGDEIRREVQEQVLPSLRDIERESMHVQAAIKEGFQPGEIDKFRRAVGLAGAETEGAARAAADFQRELGDVKYRTIEEAAAATRDLERELSQAAREAMKLAAAEEEAAIAARHAAVETHDLEQAVDELEASNGRMAKASAVAEQRSLRLAKAQDAERVAREKLIEANERLETQQRELGVVTSKMVDQQVAAQTRYTDALANREKQHRLYEKSVEDIGRAEIAQIEEVTRNRQRAGQVETKAQLAASRARRKQINDDLKAALDADRDELNSALKVYKERQNMRSRDRIGRSFPTPGGGIGDDAGMRKAARDFSQDSRSVAGQLDFLSARMGALAAVIVVAAIPAIGLLGGAIGQLGVGFSALAPAAIAGITTLKTGFAGLTEGAKSFMKQFDDVDTARFEQIGNLMAPLLTSWHDLTASIQLSFAQRLQPTFQNLGNLIDQLGPHLVHITDAFADGANLLTNGLHMVQEPLNKIIESSAEFLRDLMPYGNQVIQTFAHVGAAAAQYMPRVTQAFGNAITQITDVFDHALKSGQFDAIMQSFGPTIEGIGRLVGSLLSNLTELGAVVGPTLGPLMDSLSAFFNNLMPAFKQTGVTLSKVLTDVLPGLGSAFNNLGPSINELIPALGTIINIAGKALDAFEPLITAGVKGLGAALSGLADGLKPLYPIIEQIATQLAPILVTAGQSLGQVFVQLGPAITQSLNALVPTITKLIPDITNIIAAFTKAVTDLGPGVLLAIVAIVKPLAEIVNALAHIPGLISGVAYAFVAWKSLTVIGAVLGSLRNIGAELASMPGRVKRAGLAFAGGDLAAGASSAAGAATKVEKSTSRIRTALKGLRGAGSGLAGMALLGAGAAGESSGSGLGQGLGVLGSTAGGALLGATLGGPLGAGLGALGGAAVGVFQLIASKSAEAEAVAAQTQQDYQTQLLATQAALKATGDAQKALNDDLTDSKGKITPTTLNSIGTQVAAIPDKLKGSVNPDVADEAKKAIDSLGLSEKQLASQIAGDQNVFDALDASLKAQGPAGALAAQQLEQIRGDVLGAASAAATAAPALQTLANSWNVDLSQAAANVRTAFKALPEDIPLNIHMAGADAVMNILKQLGAQIHENADGTIQVDAPLAPEVLGQLKALGVQITQNRDGTIEVHLDQTALAQARGQLTQFQRDYMNLIITPTIQPPGGNAPVLAPPSPGGSRLPIPQIPRAEGGVLPGYSPGRDNMMVPMSGGEGVVIPEAMRALGSGWLYDLNSSFRSGISRAGYRMGGVVGFAGGGVVPPDDDTELGVLKQIRDLLSGKGGTGMPLVATASNTSKMAGYGSAGGAGMSSRIGPFGTPVMSSGNPAYNAMASIIRAFGGNPEQVIGMDPSTYFGAGGASGAAGFGGGFNASAYAGPLAAFARSGVLTPELAGMGLDANDPVIHAILSARNRKKGNLGSDTIASLVEQVLGSGGYTGALTPQNTSLIEALQKFAQRGGRQVGLPNAPTTGAGVSSLGLTPTGSGSAQALIAFAQAANGGKYAAASDLAHGLADCSGAVSDLVELLTKGSTSPARLFDTHNEAAVLRSLGAVPGLVPGSLQIGLNSDHTAATLPNGVNFEAGGSGGGVVYGGPVGAGDKQFTQTFSLPTDMTGRVLGAGFGAGGSMMPGMFGGSMLSGMGGMGGAAGGAVPVFVTNWGGGGMGLPPGVMRGVASVGQAGAQATGQVAANVAGDVIKAVAGSPIPGAPTGPVHQATLTALTREHNPLAFAKAAGFDIPDFTRDGGQVKPADFMAPSKAYDASGRLYSNTAALADRTNTDIVAQIKAMTAQTVAAISEVKDRLTDKALTPVVQGAVTAGFEGVSRATFASMGTTVGTAAAPAIASAVKTSVASLPIDTGSSDPGKAVTDAVFASGGPVYGGVPGKDSVPALLMPGEHVFNTADVTRMGGQSAVYAFRAALASGAVRGFASGGAAYSNYSPGSSTGPNPNEVLGAQFFGLDQVPILGAIVNLLVRVLLQVLGVQIQTRNTLLDMGDDFREFRGDAFKVFNAQGRLFNDTSGLVNRSSTSEGEAADERIRILKIVIEALIKYIIEKVIVPIIKAVANAAIQAAGTAAGTAVTAGISGGSGMTAGPAGGLAGSIVQSLITSGGQAAVEIVSEVATDLSLAAANTIIDMIAEALPSLLPGVTQEVFSGALTAGVLGSVGTALSNVLGGVLGTVAQNVFSQVLGNMFGTLFGAFSAGGGLLGGFATLLGGVAGLAGGMFDDGGIAYGTGLMPKAVIAPERVLSPSNTRSFDKFVDLLGSGKLNTAGSTTHVHAPITVLGGADVAQQTHDRLLRLMT